MAGRRRAAYGRRAEYHQQRAEYHQQQGDDAMTVQPLDEQAAEQFAERMLGAINGAAVTLMVSIGNRTGLFATMAELPASTSAQIAEAAGLQERYVREWLGALVAGGIVRYDAGTRRYVLPPEHAALLTPAAGPDNLAAFAQEMASLGRAEDPVVDRFRRGGGLSLDIYDEHLGVLAEETRAMYDAALIDSILPLVPGLVERLVGGIDVLDVGSGHGHAVNVMGKTFPASTFTGYDLSEPAIAVARAEAAELGLTNARFALRDAATLDEPQSYDFVTSFIAIHDHTRPTETLAAIARSLRPGGVFLMVEAALSSELADNIDHPVAPALYAISCLACTPMSLADGGEGLGLTWGQQLARRMLTEAGFRSVEVHQLPGDILFSYFVATVD
jgi:SAM-dependent methyltransferase